MYKKGHFGLSLMIFSVLFVIFGLTAMTLVFVAFSVAFSTLPDWDHKFGIKHRAYTHNIGFGLLSSTIIALAFGYALGLYFGLLVFSAVLAGVISHLLGDIIAGQNIDETPWQIKPLKPFSDWTIGFGILKSSDESVNERFFVVGAIVFFVCLVIGVA